MKVGILGLPGSGKSTLFQLLSESFEEPDYSMPREPRLKRVFVRDARLERLRDDFQPKKFTPAAIDVLDFPAVAKAGEDRAGLADLLAPAREVQALIIVLRAFCSAAVAGGDTVDPISELGEVRGELVLSDLEVVERRLEKLDAKSKKPTFDDDDQVEQDLLGRIKLHLEGENELTTFELSADERKRLAGFGFLSAKPFVTVVNRDENAVSGETLQGLSAAGADELMVIPVGSEAEILQLPEEERDEFLTEYGVEKFHRDDVIAAAYRAAGEISFFTAGEKEVRAWTIRAGQTAPEAAGAIHSDFERGFIRAEVVSFEDYCVHGSLKKAKEAGVYRLEGKTYIVNDGDVVEFRFSV